MRNFLSRKQEAKEYEKLEDKDPMLFRPRFNETFEYQVTKIKELSQYNPGTNLYYISYRVYGVRKIKTVEEKPNGATWTYTTTMDIDFPMHEIGDLAVGDFIRTNVSRA